MRINRLTCSGLFSYVAESTIKFSGRTVIVGPNNAGKSNIFRIIRILLDALADNRSPSAFEMSRTENAAFVEAEIAFSPDECALLSEFLGYYRPRDKRLARLPIPEIAEFLAEVKIRLDWTKDVRGAGSNAGIRVSFPLCGFDLSGSPIWPDLYVSAIGAPRPKHQGKAVNFAEFCQRLVQDFDPKNRFASFVEGQGEAVLASVDFSNDAIASLDSAEDMESAIELKRRLRYGNKTTPLSLQRVLGSIMSQKTAHASASVLAHEPFSKVYKYLEQGAAGNSEFAAQFNRTASEVLRAMDLKDTGTLSPDGTNMARFLFTLKNSPDFECRQAFEKIRAGFKDVFDDKLHVDVALRYARFGADSSRAGSRREVFRRIGRPPRLNAPSFPEIMFADPSLPGSATSKQVGAGALQVLYLLAASSGIKNSVVLLDEPGINLHPAMLQAVMDKVGSDEESQFAIITHSPDVLSYEAFGKGSEVIYVKNSGGRSCVCCVRDGDGASSRWNAERKSLRHIIDVRVFFSNLAILVEGQSDQRLLAGVAEHKAGEDAKYDLARRNIVIADACGKDNLPTYADLLDAYQIAYVILADRDDGNAKHEKMFRDKKTADFPSDCQSCIDADIVLVEKDLERLMESIDERAFEDAKRASKASKVAVAIKFCRLVKARDPQKLRGFAAFLDYCIGRASGAQAGGARAPG